ncbi:MAG: pyridoxamine 5'-phosphate oxidase family protein [Dehalococcoidia bacterium]|nr:pyridoxamine 5'-phosphate oxidase family protein [Dehalococcoidia bacterium]
MQAAPQGTMYRVDDDIKELAEGAVAAAVGSASADGVPQHIPGWGLRIRDDRISADIFIDAPRAADVLANLRETGRIAVTFGSPVTYQSIQFKGMFVECAEPTPEECAWVEQQREAVASSLAIVGDSIDRMRNLWMSEILRVRFTIERAFDQTPGPAAGKPL